ncbi:hypothetical protein N7492_002477 [Penicillium capsulatum]|uniref:UbiA prenyltransferase n=1 Tax=Penicillium capsulatum TaxID=69766 RepID=A0A9W9IK48_9EURO|nr:hypothetical protein N7492_002477 [Penicillium capsulatum]KAJ6122919.1 hypothetical protein N7512_005384 [Penicillium capsulatum]
MTGQASSTSRSLPFHLKTLWLISRSDVAPVLVPHCIAGLANLQSGWVLGSNQPAADVTQLIIRLGCMAIWIWLNLLSLDLANQRLDESVEEDSINKPWRPIPAGRLSQNEARHLQMLVIPATLGFSYFAGGLQESYVMIALNWIYNDLGAANENFWLRNLMNALGFMDFIVGASVVAGGPGAVLSHSGWLWVAMMGGCIFTTISLQDLYDQEGDSLRDRKTAPLVLGDLTCRVMVSVAVLGWSLATPFYLGFTLPKLAILMLLSMTIVGRTFAFRSAASDRRTFKIWCLWIVVLYALPALPDLPTGLIL